MNQLRTDNVYTLIIREKVNKKIQYGAAMFIAKTSIQIAIIEDVTAELIGILTQFIMKYHRNTESLQDLQEYSIQDTLSILPDISNPVYHKPKGQPSKWYKLNMGPETSERISESFGFRNIRIETSPETLNKF
ncbi:hypothetical protein RhiirC2_857220 [Rhizophagus irregularis]|uniref:Uncharacterized protein n=1 Tax=Rhizophagus irregularis TaxID=588596 RepID=A0A2N1MDK7_9GLOM|nr:hypothetical protein RhiirC2_857220 [Rhizophagus irregularis]